jgi:uncharacterized protein YbbC (DUF1343 family)
MGLAMEAAASAGKEFVVLDRPNPIGGLVVGGPMLDRGSESFVGFHHLPVRHGMTIGELAQMFKKERKLNLKLTVVPVKGWRRGMLWDQTGLYWVNPSPNMRSPHAALLYPGVGLLETTNVSVGRGTDTPFEVFGAPWIDGHKLASDLSQQDHQGLAFTPIRFTPDSSKFAGDACEGVKILITDRQQVRPIHLGMSLAHWLRKQYPQAWQVDRFDRLLGNQQVFELIKAGAELNEIEAAYLIDVDRFRRRRMPFLIYP